MVAADVSLGGFLPGWALHGAKWVAIFVIPLGILWFAEIRSGRGKLERLGSIVADLPTSARAHVNYATELQEAGRADEAAKEFAEAIRLNPGSAKAHVSLGSLLTAKGELDAGRRVILSKHYASTRRTLNIIPATPIFWTNWVARTKRLLNVKRLFVWRRSRRKRTTAMALSWKNTDSQKRQSRNIARRLQYDPASRRRPHRSG